MAPLLCLNEYDYKSFDNLVCMPLWYNQNISNFTMIKSTWYNHGIVVIGDVISDGKFLSKEAKELLYDLPEINFLDYYQVRADVNKFLQKYGVLNQLDNIRRPYIPSHFQLLLKSKSGCQDMYYKMIKQNFNVKYQQKWSTDLGIVIDDQTWKEAFTICFQSVSDHQIIWLQYKILHHILGTQKQLFKMKISDSDYCRICNSNVETLIHLFVTCGPVKKLWDDLVLWLCDSTSIQLNLQAKDIILGYLLKTDYFVPVNVILLITKLYIFSCAISKSPLNPSHLKKKLKSLYNYEFLIHKEKYKEEVFEKNWNKLLKIFE